MECLKSILLSKFTALVTIDYFEFAAPGHPEDSSAISPAAGTWKSPADTIASKTVLPDERVDKCWGNGLCFP